MDELAIIKNKILSTSEFYSIAANALDNDMGIIFDSCNLYEDFFPADKESIDNVMDILVENFGEVKKVTND